MDEITASLAASFSLSKNNIHSEHPRFCTYKNEGRVAASQRERRESFLQRQYGARDEFRDRFRSIHSSFYGVDADGNQENSSTIIANDKQCIDSKNDTIIQNNCGDDTYFAGNSTMGFENMDFSSWGISKTNKNLKKKVNNDGNRQRNNSGKIGGKANNNGDLHRKSIDSLTDYLMFSEWLVDIPESTDLSNDWVMMVCPMGKRSLLVAVNGYTSVYNKSGHRMSQFQSDFPGGSRSNLENCTILDCIFDKVSKRYFVLDLLCWNSVHFADTEFNNRQFFLQSRYAEIPELAENGAGGYSYHLLPSCKCTVDAMTKLMKIVFDYELDGLLFYHSKAFYTPGQTPLVGWLKPWMLPEILNVEVSIKYISEQGFYASSRQFIDRYNEKHKFKSTIVKTPFPDSSDKKLNLQCEATSPIELDF